MKFLVSSTLRNFWEGEIIVFRESDVPLNKVERKNVTEKIVHNTLPPEYAADVDYLADLSKREFLFQLDSQIAEKSREGWLLIVDAATLIQRNIEHLFPDQDEAENGFRSPPVDLLWAPSRGGGARESEGASIGFFAIRARLLADFLSLWKKLHKKNNLCYTSSEILLQAIRKSELNHGKFEKGEVLEVDAEAMNWNDMQRAAVLTFPAWKHEDQVSIIQSLYFGMFYGDQTGLLVNMLEA
ncbi:MAG: hypothetical protein EOP88_06400 [Verrucomicrobiaceae bacterium]|nr:MAG: hypothetical protein EOP88_06400 [Verrucomicrobiaceae bacterium]